MTALDELINIDGVVIACEFSPDGKCTNVRSKMSLQSEKADKSAQYIATVTMMFNTLADAFTKESGMHWIPQHNWSYSGGDWTVVVGGNQAVFVDSFKADLNKITHALGRPMVEAAHSI